MLRTSPTLARATYSSDAIRLACQNGHTAVLQWWLDSGLPLRYSAAALTAAADKRHLHVLAWWRASGLEIRLSTYDVVRAAASRGHFDVLQWCLDTAGPSLLSDTDAANVAAYASARGDLAILQWLKDNGLPVECTKAAVDDASSDGHLTVLQWWRDSGRRFRFSNNAVDGASSNGHLAVLDWWRQQASGDGARLPLRLKYSMQAMSSLTEAKHVAVLEWWKASGLPLKLPHERTFMWDRYNAQVVSWWRDNREELEERAVYHRGKDKKKVKKALPDLERADAEG
ncbi:hypothetical protein DFJ73DRAFT_660313 [Zopfochytrium polystomum]|nr:hypothetical protein DFJ73DRAFT_660313 [Zopfochytrium polystomum]